VDEDEGCEGAFEPVYEVSERVRIPFSPFFPSESVFNSLIARVFACARTGLRRTHTSYHYLMFFQLVCQRLV
jgi:hypothetical protein